MEEKEIREAREKVKRAVKKLKQNSKIFRWLPKDEVVSLSFLSFSVGVGVALILFTLKKRKK